ncbi:alpha/beta fold hydrolase [Paenibacillus sp. Z6-24]
MKRWIKGFKITCITLVALVLILLFFPTWTSNIPGDNSISTLEQVQINGTDHEIMIRGNNRDNPVIINVHGGPGASEIPYAEQVQDLLESQFTIVNYDQRASGKSYHFFEDYSNLSSDLLVNDLLAVTDYAASQLGKQKVILIGHSYGTYIAAQAAYRAPGKYEAYIGIGQMGDSAQSERDSLNYVLDQARLAGNTEDVQQLQHVSTAIRQGKAFTPRSYVAKYGGATRLIENPDGDLLAMLYSEEYNALDLLRYYKGIIGSQGVLINEVFLHPLPRLVPKLELPVYFVMGKYDYMTSAKSAESYLKQLDAKHKELIIYDQSAHYPQFEEKTRFFNWMTDTFATHK